jgi:hypothetical protein
MTTVGEKVWNRLRAEGGFVHTKADGRQFVRFNRGYHPSAELVKLLKSHREELKAFIIERHAEDDRLGWGVACRRGVGTPQPPKTAAPNGRGNGVCECNGAARSSISAETPGKWDFSHRRGLCQVAPAAAAALVAILAARGEIRPAESAGAGGSVGLVSAFLTSSSSGSGEVSTQQTKGGMAWRRN